MIVDSTCQVTKFIRNGKEAKDRYLHSKPWNTEDADIATVLGQLKSIVQVKGNVSDNHREANSSGSR